MLIINTIGSNFKNVKLKKPKSASGQSFIKMKPVQSKLWQNKEKIVLLIWKLYSQFSETIYRFHNKKSTYLKTSWTKCQQNFQLFNSQNGVVRTIVVPKRIKMSGCLVACIQPHNHLSAFQLGAMHHICKIIQRNLHKLSLLNNYYFL